MISVCGRYVLTFNGEIYNHRALRAELSGTGSVFRGTSDTEVMLEAIRVWGLERSLRTFNGMFAFALWDRQERTLVLARDRIGEKPLYYGWLGDTFAFASELKALRACPGFDASLRAEAIAAYLRFNYIPGPQTIYKAVYKVPAATTVEIRPFSRPHETSVEPYWSAAAAVEMGYKCPFPGTEADAVAELEHLLADAVRLRMEADVPLGAFLSGGIDSSVIVALMKRHSTRKVKTFTVGFSEGVSEAEDAARVAAHLETDHYELRVGAQEALDVIPRLPQIYDEPFADSSQIPTVLMCQFARREVTVALSGDGGDELFGGYNRYVWANNLNGLIRFVPLTIRRGISYAALRVSSATFEKVAANSTLLSSVQPQDSSGLFRRMADFVSGSSPAAAYLAVSSRWTDAPDVIKACSFDFNLPPACATDSLTRTLMYFDGITYLPDDILVKLDRASMAVSLEARVPLVDHRVFELACRLPVRLGWNGRKRKQYLRRVLAQHVPEALFDRPKAGFCAPVGSWLRGPLREWAEDLLSESAIRANGFLNTTPIRRKWSDLLACKGSWENHLWSVIMLQAWLDNAGLLRH
jgi:asparagine synthase (glutamine-hydrolysing)